MAEKRTGVTWFVLVNGGEARAEDEKTARQELKTIYRTVLEQDLADRDHVVFISGSQGNLDPTLKHSITSVEAGELNPVIFGSRNRGERRITSKEDNAVVIFVGHGQDPSDWAKMPPSAAEDKQLGQLVFFHQRTAKKTLYQPQLPVDLKNTIFISLACYSGNAFQTTFKIADNPNVLAVCLADPDHPASYDPILGQAFADFFKQKGWEDKPVTHFSDFLQDQYFRHPYHLQMMKENMEQTEEEYESERRETMEWAVGKFAGYAPRVIPHDLWEMFREVESLKTTIEAAKPDDISQEVRVKLSEHIDKLEHDRFHLMRMYKHKPNNRLCLYGAKDTIGQMTWREFLHLK